MKDDQLHNDELEQFYQSAFDSAEMDVPAHFTDALMQKLETTGLQTPAKKSLSERIGSKKLFRFLQVSLAFNLVTVSIIGYHLLNNEKEVIEIGIPHANPIIKIDETSPSNETNTKENVIPVPSQLTQPKENHKDLNTNTPKDPILLNEDLEKDSLSFEIPPVNEKKVDPIINSDPLIGKETELKNNNGPSSLEDLRNSLKDSLKGRELFE